jgi:hypothetical protein
LTPSIIFILGFNAIFHFTQLTLKDLYFTEITMIRLIFCTTHIYHSKHTYFTLKPSVYVSNYLNVTHIAQTNLPITFSASHRSCTTDPRALFLIGAPPPSPVPAAGSVPPPTSCLDPPLPHPRPQTGAVCSPLASPTFAPAVGGPCHRNLDGSRRFPAQRTLLFQFQYFLEDFCKILGTHL